MFTKKSAVLVFGFLVFSISTIQWIRHLKQKYFRAINFLMIIILHEIHDWIFSRSWFLFRFLWCWPYRSEEFTTTNFKTVAEGSCLWLTTNVMVPVPTTNCRRFQFVITIFPPFYFLKFSRVEIGCICKHMKFTRAKVYGCIEISLAL